MAKAIDWGLVEPMVVKTEPQDAVLMVTFKCPVSGQEMIGGGTMMKGMARAGAKNVAAQSAKQGVFSALWRGLTSLFGGGAGAQVAAGAASRAASSSADAAGPKVRVKHSDAEIQAACVKAFEQLVEQGTFIWSEEHGDYMLAHAAAMASAGQG